MPKEEVQKPADNDLLNNYIHITEWVIVRELHVAPKKRKYIYVLLPRMITV